MVRYNDMSCPVLVALVFLCVFRSLGLGPSPEPKEDVRSQLAGLQDETGLALLALDMSSFARINFKNRSTVAEPLPPKIGTEMNTLSGDGKRIAFSDPVSGILTVMRRDGTEVRSFPEIR